MDMDRVIVMEKGKIMEFDEPKKLIENEKSIFYGMIKDANLVT